MNSSELDGRFKIRSPLRCEGAGSLDCAEDVESGQRMAIRWLPLDANGEAAAKTVEKLPSHPTLPRIRATGRVGTAAYVAMDFPEGKLLSTFLGEPLSATTLRKVGAAMADALAAVHQSGSFHGELSADSVLMLPDQRAILWDMPLVIANRLTDRRGEVRLMSQLIRIAPFLAPERARGLPTTPASDVYALGAVLCLAAGGRAPSCESTLGVIHELATQQWAPEVPSGLPGSLRETLEKMLDPVPACRPTAAEAAKELGRVDAPVSAKAPEPALKEEPMASVAVPVVAPRADVSSPELPRTAAVTEPEMPAVHFPGFASDMVAAAKALEAQPAKAAIPVEVGPVLVVPTPSFAVVAPSIEVSTDQLRPSEIELMEPVRRPPAMVLWLAAAFAALFVAGAVIVALNFRSVSQPITIPVAPAPVAQVAPPAPAPQPAAVAPKAASEEADLLQPLTAKQEGSNTVVKKTFAPAHKTKAAKHKAQAASAASAAFDANPVPTAEDFSFLKDAPAAAKATPAPAPKPMVASAPAAAGAAVAHASAAPKHSGDEPSDPQ